MTAAPATPTEFEESLLDQSVMKTLMDETGHINPNKMAAHVRKYASDMQKDDPDLGKQIAEGLKEGLKDFYEQAGVPKGKAMAMGDLGAPGLMGVARPEVYNGLGLNRKDLRAIAATGRGPGVELFGKYETFGQFLAEVPKLLNAMSESVLGDGGALVPEEFRATLLALELETAVMRSRATVIPMGSATLRLPRIHDASHASTVFGGVSASWAAEAASIATNTQPTFGQILLTARKLTGYTVAANELLADSAVALEALIMTLFAQALAFFEDDAYIQGIGAGQPLGVLNADALVTVSKETGQTATTINYQNIVKMFARVLPTSMNRGFWLAHPDTFPQLAQLALNVGTGGSAVFISNLAGAPPVSILGRPVIFSEKAQTLGTAGDLMFIDGGYYLIGDRQALQIMGSPHVNFNTDQMTWRFTQRVDGRPWITSALTPRRGTNTLSPFVALATRS